MPSVRVLSTHLAASPHTSCLSPAPFHVNLTFHTPLSHSGVVAVIEEASSERQIQLQSRTQYVRHVLRAHRLPHALVHRVSAYMHYKEHSAGGVNMEVLAELPEGIVADVMYYMVGGLLQQVTPPVWMRRRRIGAPIHLLAPASSLAPTSSLAPNPHRGRCRTSPIATPMRASWRRWLRALCQ